ncbi:ATP-binding cassette sub-family G member 1-like [Lycorma delicatula]|uniref:ATP-binding cassette sub-family G member 1-like n=1 Tax=Lycorma delicatula TaxID=130591 RepID=UPI003F517D28
MGSQATDKYSLEFEDLVYSVTTSGKEKKAILNGISGRFRPGYLSAILGPSGAGKTTLLNILSGLRSVAVRGSVKVNCVERNPQTFRQLSCYITQEFSMFSVLTVRETLDIAAHIKVGDKVKKNERNYMIEDIANVLGLNKVLDTRVSRLSGGEKKRLSIGVELVTNPPIMFFDEPTSGLDSVASLQVVTHLKRLAEEGRTVIIVIHQPSSRLLELIDDVFIITEGRCLYNGPLNDLIPTFNTMGINCPQYYNRSDFALEVACRERGDYVNQLVNLATKKHQDRLGHFYQDDNENNFKKQVEQTEEAESEQNAMLKNGNDGFVSVKLNVDDHVSIKTNVKKKKKTKYPVSKCTQFKILLKRSVICNLRDLKLAFLKIVTHIVVGLSLGAVYYNFGSDGAKVFSNLSCLFFMIIFIFYGTALHTVMTFPAESSAIVREHFNNWYPLGVYQVAKTVADIPLHILCPTIFLMISYYLTGQPLEWNRFFKIWLIGISLSIIAQTFGCIMGTAFGTQLALFLAATCTMPTFLISGFFIHLSDLSPYLSWLSYISIFRYCLEGYVLALYGSGRNVLHCSKAYCHYKQPRKFLQELGMDKGDYWFNATTLILITISLQIILFYTMKYKVASIIKNS